MERLEAFEREFQERLAVAKTKLNGSARLYGEYKKRALHDAQQALDLARQSLGRVDETAAQLGSQLSRQYHVKQRLASLGRELTAIEKQLDNALLTGGTSSSYQQGAVPHAGQQQPVTPWEPQEAPTVRTKLLATNERLGDTSERLGRTVQVAAETENIGVDILGQLADQRGALERTHAQVNGVNDGITRSRSILRGIARRVVTNNIILAVIAVVLFVAILFVVFFKWIRPRIPEWEGKS